MAIIIGIPVNPRGRYNRAELLHNYIKDAVRGVAHTKTFAVGEFVIIGNFVMRNKSGTAILTVEEGGDIRGGGDIIPGTGGQVVQYVGKSLPFLLGADPDLGDLLHCRVQVVDALAKLVSTTDPTLNTDLIWSGFSSTGVTPFFYKVSGVLTQWPAAGVPKASWGAQAVCLVPFSASALVSGTTYYARGWLWDGAAYGQPDDISFVG